MHGVVPSPCDTRQPFAFSAFCLSFCATVLGVYTSFRRARTKKMSAPEKPSSIIVNWEPSAPVSTMELKNQLQEKDAEPKVAALKQIIAMLTNGENLASLFMPVTQHVATAKDHYLKRLLLLYWEVIEKRQGDGTLNPLMILFWYAVYKDSH